MANELREYEIELRKEGETKARKKLHIGALLLMRRMVK